MTMERAGISVFVFLLVLCLASAQSCGTIGNDDDRELDEKTEQRFYLDINNPATCNGTITSWTVCYYGPNDVRGSRSYWATYAVYRRNGSDEGERYERVSGIFSAVRVTRAVMMLEEPMTDGLIRQRGFMCYNDSIVDTSNSPLTVQEGDIIGACVFSPQDEGGLDRRELDIVGEITNGESLLLDNNDLVNTCTMDIIPSSIQCCSDFRELSNRRLHIYANIAPEPTSTEAMTQDVTTVQNTGAGNTPIASSRTGAIVGGIFGVLLSLVLVVAIVVVVVLYLVRRRQAGGKHLTGRETNGDTGLDNKTCGTGEDIPNNGKAPILEVGTYEVPMNSTASAVTQATMKTEPQYYELTESTYAVPNMYEYATLGPNDEQDFSSGQYYSPLDEATISYAKLLEKNKQEDIYGNVEEYLQPATGESELYAQIKACGIKNILSNCIQINGHLGSGQFGSVERGLWKDGTRNIHVAVKLLREEATETDKVKFLQEAAIMAQFKHPNVVSLYGVVSKTEPLMLVVELIEKGNLREHLHTLRPDPGQLPVASIPKLLLSFSQQVALGMQYLSAKRFVHRDLAARNILVSKDNICKVADFGMSRDLADETYYVSQGGQVPVKWTAPEAIHYKKYSVSSDVWSYGCLLYEIWSLGYKPFEGTANAKVIRLVDSGQRLSPPPGCSRVIYELMIKCWNPVAASRPGFREIFLSLIDSTEKVLSIPPEALDTHHLAGILGSPLEAGENMYPDLHDKYLAESDYVNEIN